MAKKKENKTIVLFLFGAALVALFVSYKIYRSTVLSFYHAPSFNYESVKNRDFNNLPVFVEIANVNLAVSIEETAIVHGNWQIAENGASHLAQSSYPTEKGSIIIYAHNSRDRFGSLTKVKVGDTVNIRTRKGVVVSYIVTQKIIVSPREIATLNPSNKETLILYTCTGFADMQRLVIKANPL